jgi:hypothetical protein
LSALEPADVEIFLRERPVGSAVEGADPVDDGGFATPIAFRVGRSLCIEPLIAGRVDQCICSPVFGYGKNALGHRRFFPRSPLFGNIQRCDPGQFTALHPLEKRTARSRHKSEVVCYARLVQRRNSIAATCY